MKDNLLFIANFILMGTCIISWIYGVITRIICVLAEAYGEDCTKENKRCFISLFLAFGTLVAIVILNTVFDNWV